VLTNRQRDILGTGRAYLSSLEKRCQAPNLEGLENKGKTIQGALLLVP
jgi:hypothetical protein